MAAFFLLALCAVGVMAICPSTAIAAPSRSWLAPKITHSQKGPTITVDLLAAIQQGMVQAQFKGNGRELLRLTIYNKSSQMLLVCASEGHIFKSGENTVAIMRPSLVELAPGERKDQDAQAVALYSSNRIQAANYTLSAERPSRLDGILNYLLDHPETAPGAIQTAVLALTENLPLSAFAKFAQPGTDLPSHFDTKAFKADTSDIISALSILKEIGFRDDQIALTIDPQLKIEAMIDPMAHAFAMRYYGIKYDQEWLFWKNELLKGNPATRHYALHGIARYYPDVALKMLPQWAREPRTEQVYRISAIQALSETNQVEAVSILRQLQQEFAQTELGLTARTAAEVLQNSLDHQAQCLIAFHVSGSLPRVQSLIETLEQSIQIPAPKTQSSARSVEPPPVIAAAAN